MKKLFPLFLLIPIALFTGCGDDDDGGTNGGGETLARLAANTSVTAPTMTSPDESVWNSVDSVVVEVGTSGDFLPKPADPAAPANVTIQAILDGTDLYMRVRWSDLSFDAYPGAFVVIDSSPPIEFDDNALDTFPGPFNEDQMLVMFKNPVGDDYDCWNWQVLSTGGANLGRGLNWGDSVTFDAVGTPPLTVTLENSPTFSQPTYFHKDTSEFTGYLMFIEDIVGRNDSIGYDIDTTIIPGDPPDTLIDTTTITPRMTDGWAMGQIVPRLFVDSSAAGRTPTQRGSLYDIDAVDNYSDGAGMYSVVLKGSLNTGYTDDLDLSAVDSVMVKIGVWDNQYTFTSGGPDRGFTKLFWLIL